MGAKIKSYVVLMLKGLDAEKRLLLCSKLWPARGDQKGITDRTLLNWLSASTPANLCAENISAIKEILELPPDYVVTELIETKEAAA